MAVRVGTLVFFGPALGPAVGVTVGISVPLRVGSARYVAVAAGTVGLLRGNCGVSVAARATTAWVGAFGAAVSTVSG